MNFIETIEIKNFKSIRHQKIEGCRRVNVLVGYPNTGKSNILEAISLLSYVNRNEITSLKYFCRFKELIDIFNDGDKEKDAEIFANGYVGALRYIDKNAVEFGLVSIENYVEKFSASTVLLLRSNSFDKEGRSVRTSTTEYTEKIILKKYHFSESSNLSDYGTNPKVLSHPYGTNIAEVIRYDGSLRKECGELLSLYNLKLIFDEEGKLVVQKQLDEFTAFQFSYSQVADTLKRLIFHKAAIKSNENSVLLFEEPEAHMFPPYISKFTSDIMSDKGKNQFIITTHSPFVLSDFMENLKSDELAIFIVRYKKESGETLIEKMTPNEMHKAAQFGYDFFLNMKNFMPAD